MRWRRIAFIATSWDRFTAAQEINDLYASGADGLYVTLKEAGLYPEREVEVREGRTRYVAELAIPCVEGMVAIAVDVRPPPGAALYRPSVDEVHGAIRGLGGVKPPHPC